MTRMLLVLMAVVFSVSSSFAATPQQRKIAIAIDEMSEGLPLLSDEISARVIRSLIAQPLFVKQENGRITHLLTDGLSRDLKGNTFSVRLRKNVLFSNGSPVEVVDVLDSFKRCRQGDAELGNFTSRITLFSEDLVETWLDFPVNSDEEYNRTVTFIEKCPIFMSRNGIIFGADFGLGTNIVAAGEFFISNFRAGLNYVLTRSGTFPERTGAPEVEVQHTLEPRKTLSLLRAGSVDAMITNDQGSIDSARQDSTLQIGPCYGKTLIKRNGLVMSCDQDYELRNVGYVSE